MSSSTYSGLAGLSEWAECTGLSRLPGSEERRTNRVSAGLGSRVASWISDSRLPAPPRSPCLLPACLVEPELLALSLSSLGLSGEVLPLATAMLAKVPVPAPLLTPETLAGVSEPTPRRMPPSLLRGDAEASRLPNAASRDSDIFAGGDSGAAATAAAAEARGDVRRRRRLGSAGAEAGDGRREDTDEAAPSAALPAGGGTVTDSPASLGESSLLREGSVFDCACGSSCCGRRGCPGSLSCL